MPEQSMRELESALASVRAQLEAERVARLDAALSGISLDQALGLDALPAWTLQAAVAASLLPGDLTATRSTLSGLRREALVEGDESPLALRDASGTDRLEVVDTFWTTHALRTHLQDAVSDDDRDRVIASACQRLLASGIPLPLPTWRAARLGAMLDEEGRQETSRIGAELRAQVEQALSEGEAGAGPYSRHTADRARPEEALAWVSAARELSAALSPRAGEGLRLAAELAGRAVDFHLRLRDDWERDREFVGFAETLKQLHALLDGDGAVWGLHVLGEGGVGKTMLLRHVLLERRRVGWLVARVDFDLLNPAYPRRDPVLFLGAILTELRLQARDGRQARQFERVGDHLGAARGRIAPRASGGASLDRELLGIIRSLAGALNGLSVLLMIDTCEELERLGGTREGSEAVRATFAMLEALRSELPGLRVIFGGRRTLASEGKGWTAPSRLEPRPWLAAIELFGFSRSDADEFLARLAPSDDAERWGDCVEAMLHRTLVPPAEDRLTWIPERPGGKVPHYQPFELSLLARWVAIDDGVEPEELASRDRDVYVERRILPRLHPAFRHVLPGLAACGVYDELLVRALCDDEEQAALVWREAAHQEWVRGSTWITIEPRTQARLDRVLQETESGRRTEQVEIVLLHLRNRLIGDLLRCDPLLVDAWVRAGSPSRPEDAVFWEDLVRRAAEADGYDWLDKVTGQLLGASGALADRQRSAALDLPVRLTRMRVLSQLRPGRTDEWISLWRGIERSASEGEVGIRALASTCANRLAQGRLPAREDVSTLEALWSGEALPSASLIPGLLSFLDAAVEYRARGGGDVVDRQAARRFLARVADQPGAPLRGQAAVLSLRLAPAPERLELGRRWVSLWQSPEPDPPQLAEISDFPRTSHWERRLCLEASAVLWSWAMDGAEVLSFFPQARPSHESSDWNSLDDRLASTHLRIVAAARPTSLEAMFLADPLPQETASPERAIDGDLTPFFLAHAVELAASGLHQRAIQACEAWLDAAARAESGYGAHAGERALSHILSLARPVGSFRWRFPTLWRSRHGGMRMDAAAPIRFCGEEFALTRAELVVQIDSAEELDLAWRTGALPSRSTSDTQDRFNELFGPLPEFVRDAMAFGDEATRWVSGADPTTRLHVELDLVELAELLREVDLPAPPARPPDLLARCRAEARRLSLHEPAQGLILAARAESLLGDTSTPPLQEVMRRHGPRRTAGLLHMEGERLALRVPSAGCRLLRLARQQYLDCEDVHGALRATILAELAWRRSAGALRPPMEEDAIKLAWERCAGLEGTTPVGVPLPPWNAPGSLPEDWLGWAIRAFVAADRDVAELGDQAVQELARLRGGGNAELLPRWTRGQDAAGRIAAFLYRKLDAAGSVDGAPAWLVEWLRPFDRKDVTADRVRTIGAAGAMTSTFDRKDVTGDRVRPSTFGEPIFRGGTGTETPTSTEPVAKILRELSSPDADSDPLGLGAHFRLVFEGREVRVRSSYEKALRTWPRFLSSRNIKPQILQVDRSSAAPDWEAILLEGDPDRPLRRVPSDALPASRSWPAPDPTGGVTVITDDPSLSKQLPGRSWDGFPGERRVLPWETLRQRRTQQRTTILHLVSAPIIEGRGVLLGSDHGERWISQSAAIVRVEAERLVFLFQPSLVVVHPPLDEVERGSDSALARLRFVALELVQLGVPAVLVLPAQFWASEAASAIGLGRLVDSDLALGRSAPRSRSVARMRGRIRASGPRTTRENVATIASSVALFTSD